LRRNSILASFRTRPPETRFDVVAVSLSGCDSDNPRPPSRMEARTRGKNTPRNAPDCAASVSAYRQLWRHSRLAWPIRELQTGDLLVGVGVAGGGGGDDIVGHRRRGRGSVPAE